MFKFSRLAMIAAAFSASASAASFDYNTVSLGYGRFSDINQYSLKFNNQLTDNWVVTSAVRAHNENYKYSNYTYDGWINDINVGMKYVAQVADSADVYFGMTLNYVTVSSERKGGSYPQRITGSDFGYAVLGGFQVGVTESTSVYGEFRYTEANGDEVDVRNNMLEIGGEIHFSDSVSLSVANIQGKVWNSRIDASRVGYDSAFYVGLNYHY